MYICCLYFGLTNLCCCSAGLTPQVTNPAGQRPNVCYSELSRCYTMVHAAVLRADKTQLHEHQRKSQNTNEKVFLAFPNDRATSLRPADADTEYRCAQRLQRAYFFFFCNSDLPVKCGTFISFLVFYMQDNLYWCKAISLYRHHFRFHWGRGEAETAA